MSDDAEVLLATRIEAVNAAASKIDEAEERATDARDALFGAAEDLVDHAAGLLEELNRVNTLLVRLPRNVWPSCRACFQPCAFDSDFQNSVETVICTACGLEQRAHAHKLEELDLIVWSTD